MTTVEELRAAGILSPLDEHFARTMGRLAGDARPEVLVAAALASRQVANGHVCLDLPRLAAGAPLLSENGEPLGGAGWPDRDGWLAALRASALVGEGAGATPLVLDGSGRLYLRRYWEHERRLAAAVRERAAGGDGVDAAWLRPALDRLFPRDPTAPDDQPDWQRVAAAVALQRRFCVISGGPGTGKTFTVVKLLALTIEQALRRRQPLPRVLLLAPTGKAAARLSEAIRRTTAGLDCAAEVKAAIPGEASTIHRGLGFFGGSATRARHHAGNPLGADLVLVDEASMVDLALMTRLVAALPAAARLVLLGDQDQLASVEAGAVLGDICNTGAPRPYSAACVDAIAALTGEQLPVAAGAPHEAGLGDCIVQLTRSYRYGAESGIGLLARAINAGDGAAALRILESAAHPDVALAAAPADGTLGAALRQAALDGFRPYIEAGDPAERLRELERFRAVCAHRRGRGGVEDVNRQIEAELAGAGLLHTGGAAYAGRPVMVTRNDYQLELFNGDVGVMLENEAGGGGMVVAFPGAGGTVRTLSAARLPAHETVFAVSVHKSQGSEFDEVAVVLPERLSPVMSRELLYTAVTRARRRVTVYASRDVVAGAIARRIARASGLRDLLWPEAGDGPPR